MYQPLGIMGFKKSPYIKSFSQRKILKEEIFKEKSMFYISVMNLFKFIN